MIAIVDYGVGNLRSVQKAFEHVGYNAQVTAKPQVVADADAVVLPGVGAFGAAAANLANSGLLPEVLRAVRAGKPFLGICVGMQLLFEYSEENFGGELPTGLGLLAGAVRRFPVGLKVPQIGWNELQFEHETPLFKGLPVGTHVYFVHSYYCEPRSVDCIAASTDYGVAFCSSVYKDNLAAIQFHPEKSGRVGLQILHNFGEWAKQCG